jgi:F-type H+-transporting ATPase subunit b
VVVLEAGILDINATLVAQLLVFLVTLFVLYRVAWGPVLQALEARRRRIQEGVEAAERAQRELEAAEQAHRARLEKAQQEARALIEQATRMGQSVREELQQKGKQEAARLVERARAEIARERQGAAQQLRSQVADLALLAAERIIGESLDAARHRALIERTIEEAELRV